MAEKEELTLVVTLDDQASAKLANLKQQLSSLSEGGGFDQIARQFRPEEFTRG